MEGTVVTSVSSARAASAAGELARLDDRVLETLEGSRDGVAFSGLRRVLHAHPESLSRALHRLEREGLIERVGGGYRSLTPERPDVADAGADRRAIARVELPPGVTADSLVARLTGRWFGNLRWLGAFERSGERLLVWSRRDGLGTVLIGVEPSALQVYARDAEEGADPGEAEDAAYELLYHATEAMRRRPNGSAPGVALFALGDPGRGPPACDN